MLSKFCTVFMYMIVPTKAMLVWSNNVIYFIIFPYIRRFSSLRVIWHLLCLCRLVLVTMLSFVCVTPAFTFP
jgi:hypothetical protein